MLPSCVAVQVKLNAKQEKKYRNRLMASGTATSGLSSTLAFTPVQVRHGGGGKGEGKPMFELDCWFHTASASVCARSSVSWELLLQKTGNFWGVVNIVAVAFPPCTTTCECLPNPAWCVMNVFRQNQNPALPCPPPAGL